MKRHVIIGNSGAAISGVRAIRNISGEDDIILISKENCPAYSPVLTAYYLAGKITYNDMFFCNEAFYRTNRIGTLLGKTVVGIETTSKRVLLEDGSSVTYDDVLVATGSSPLIPSIKGSGLPGVFTLWTAGDARNIHDSLDEINSVAIVGAGLIGIQVMSAMVSQNKKVSFVEMSDHVAPLVLDVEAARILEDWLKSNGVDLYLNEQVTSIQENGGKKLHFSSGAELQADAVILATGIRPNSDLLQGTDVRIEQGIVINEFCQTSVEDVYAAGDVTASSDPISGKTVVKATWPNALHQGRVAGLNMAGKEVPCSSSVRFNIFTCFGLVFASMGIVEANAARYTQSILRNRQVYRKLLFDGDRLVGGVLTGYIDDAGILATMIEQRAVSCDLRDSLGEANAFMHSGRPLMVY